MCEHSFVMHRWLVGIAFSFCALMASAQEVRVAAAADLAPSVDELKRAFESEHSGRRVTFSIGSSVQLEQQIENGAPFEVFLSADTEQPQKLIDHRKADRGTFFIYGNGILTLLVPRTSSVHSIQDLASDQVKKVAIANPAHAPYGRAAVAALKAAQLYERVQPKMVQGENVSQTAQFVISGNADAGLVSMSAKTAAGERFTAYPVDPSLYPPIQQAVVLTNGGAQNPTAREFLQFMHSQSALRILQEHGLQTSKAVLRPVQK
jgi:molybdate transport system substrate-binding protein